MSPPRSRVRLGGLLQAVDAKLQAERRVAAARRRGAALRAVDAAGQRAQCGLPGRERAAVSAATGWAAVPAPGWPAPGSAGRGDPAADGDHSLVIREQARHHVLAVTTDRAAAGGRGHLTAGYVLGQPDGGRVRLAAAAAHRTDQPILVRAPLEPLHPAETVVLLAAGIRSGVDRVSDRQLADERERGDCHRTILSRLRRAACSSGRARRDIFEARRAATDPELRTPRARSPVSMRGDDGARRCSDLEADVHGVAPGLSRAWMRAFSSVPPRSRSTRSLTDHG